MHRNGIVDQFDAAAVMDGDLAGQDIALDDTVEAKDRRAVQQQPAPRLGVVGVGG